MLPQERFVFEILFKGYCLGQNLSESTKKYEDAMKERGLIYRKGKNIDDLRRAFWDCERVYRRRYDDYAERVLERLDKVLTIDWVQMYRVKHGAIRI